MRSEIRSSESQIQEARAIGDELQRERGRLQQNIDYMDSNIGRWRESRQNRVNMFGARMDRIIRDVEDLEARRMWEGNKPIGPFGMFVQPNDPQTKWAKLIDLNIGKALAA